MNDLLGKLAYSSTRSTMNATRTSARHSSRLSPRSPTETMALCTALQAPQATARLLETEPTSKEESAAVGSIAPVLTECLKKDTQLTVNKPALRALLALAAWRIVTTPKAPA